VPVPRLHKPSGRARVFVDGKYIYLGAWGSDEADQEYRRLVLESLVDNKPKSFNVTINTLLAHFIEWAEKHYVKPSGRPTGNTEQFAYAVRPLRSFYADKLTNDFGPLALKAVREAMILSGLCRYTVNKRIDLIRQVFGWGVENEMVQETVYRALMTVKRLEPGKTAAPDRPPIPQVCLDDVLKTIKHCHKTLADMIRVQLLGGMRPNEVCQMRPSDIDCSDDIWVYTPHEYKTQHHKKSYRTIPIIPECQAILMPYLMEREKNPESYIFSPHEAVKLIRMERQQNRKTPVRPLQKYRKSKPKRKPGECYNHRSYRHAVDKTIERAGVPHWSPNQLRHTQATEINSTLGLEAARILLGHESEETTKIYLDPDVQRKEQAEAVKEVARKINTNSKKC